jgi:hypothetical protein
MCMERVSFCTRIPRVGKRLQGRIGTTAATVIHSNTDAEMSRSIRAGLSINDFP